MKIAKKSLSVFLSLLMIFSACSVSLAGLSITAAAASGTLQAVKDALTDDVVHEIVYNGSVENNSYTYKGDADVVAAADEIYAYAMSLRAGNATTSEKNSTAGLLAAVAANTGFTSGDKYTALQYILDPPGDVISGIDTVTPAYGGTCDGCDHKWVYNTIPTEKSQKTVKVYTTANSLLEDYDSIDDIPASLLQGVTFTYSMVADQACLDDVVTEQVQTGTDCDGNPTYEEQTTRYCYGYRWNYFSSLKRTEIKNIVSVEELKAFEETLASADLSMTFDEMIALPAAELQAIYDENYAPYQAMIDKYTFDKVEKFFGSYNQYFRDLLKAMQINLAMPAIDILLKKVGKTYDSTNYDEMLSIYASANAAYNVIKGFGSEVFDYIKEKAEYADFDLAAANSYLYDLKKAMDLITLPDLKTAIDADLAAYAGADLNTMDIAVLKTLLNKLEGYKGTIDAANGAAVSAVMASTVNNLNNLIDAIKATLEVRAPEDVEEAFNAQYDYYTPLLFGNYSAMSNADLMAMYSDYDANLEALQLAYDEQVAKYGAAVVNPLFSVTIGEGGSATLIQNAVTSIGTSQIKADLVARNSAQLATAAGYKDMAADVNFDNLVIVGSAVKNFDQALYQLCADNGWVGNADAALYNDVSAIINAYNAFVNKINTSGFQKVELDENGVYVVRDVYDEDLVKDEAYEVTETKLNDTIVKLDNFIASEDFGALLGFEDADGNPVGLGDYLYGMINELLFNDDLINMVVGMLFPMIEDLLNNEIGALLSGEDVNPNGIPPQNPGALGYVDLSSLIDLISGGIDVYIGDTTKEGQQKIQQDFPTLLKSAGLYVFPTTLADSMVSSGVLTTSSETYKILKDAGKTWTSLGEFDPETETFTYNLNLDWGITDKETFTKVLGGVLDSVGALLPTLFLNTAFDKTLGSADSPAGVGYGSISALSIVNIENSEFYATLGLSVQPLNLYANLFQPLFGLLGVTANASLSGSSKGIDYAKAILDPIFELLDKVVTAPLDTILGLLPSLAYILSTDFIDSFLGSIVLDFSVKLGIAGSNAGGLFGTLLNALGGALSFEVFGDQMGIADIAGAATLKDLVGIDISNLNALLDFLFETLEVELDLPDIDQTGLIECAKWNSKSSLTADKADVLFFLLDYLVSVLNPEFINSIIGLIGGEDGEEPDEMLTNILDSVAGNISNHPDDVIAALVELFNPVEYELKELTAPAGADESIVYLHYANDWTKSESQYILDNALNIVATILKLTESEITDITAFLKENVDGLFADVFTNETITKLVETFATMDPLADILNDILVEQLGVNMGAWANDFGYLFDETKTAPETPVLGVTAVADEEGNIVWNGMADGDRDAFIDTLCALLAPFAPAVAFLLGGEDLGVFGVVELKGYESFDASLGLLLEALGVPVPAVDFAADPMGSLNSVIDAVFAWLDATLAADDLAERAVKLVAGLFRFIESNGLSVVISNLLMPVLSLVDTVRPLINVDVNTVLSVIVSDLINGEELDIDKILDLVLGTYEGTDDILVTVTVDNLTLTSLLKIADKLLGTNLVESSLATIGLKGLCNEDIDAADALTIIISTLIDCLDEPAADTSKTNAQALFGFIGEKTGNDQIGEIVATVLNLIEGIVYEYDEPDWGYMFGEDEEFGIKLPKHSIVYLGYGNNWTKETADAVYDALDEIVDLVLASTLEEGETLSTLIDGLLNGKVYTDANLKAVVELLVNLLADFDAKLFELVDVVVDTNISTWFTFCEIDEATGEYVCTYDWGVDAAAEADKKDVFLAGLKTVLEPANSLLAWLFFGDSYEFFTDSEKDENGNYTYKSLITLNGGEGYAKGLVPILEALGLEMQPAKDFYNEATKTYNVGEAVVGIVDSLLNFVDDVLAAPIDEVFELLPNIIYFVNANGIKSSVNNLLAPVNAILAELSAVVGDVSIGGLLEKEIGFDITNITMDTLLKLAEDNGIKMSEKHKDLIKTFYIGELSQFTSANGDYAYRIAYTDEESAGDMLTIVLSLALDLLVLNEELFAPILGEETYGAIIDLFEITEAKAMETYDWKFVEYADTDHEFNATNTSVKYSVAYNNIWTRDKAEYIADNLIPFVTNILGLIGLEINGVEIRSLDDLLDTLLEGNLYTQETADMLMDTLKSLPDLFGEYAEIGKQAINIVDGAIGTSIASWETMEVTVEDGNRDSFIAALEKMLAPVVPLLDVLLCEEDLSFFYNIEGNDVITIPGSAGYAYGIIPIFEALGCEMMTPDEFKALSNEDKIGAIIEPLLDRVDVILADPVNEIFAMLPEIIYFINSNGLDTAVKNIINTVDTVLAALEPILGATDLMSLLGVDLAQYNFDYIVNMACDAITDATGLDVEPLIVDFVAELTMGKVYSYTSANGETYYKMAYAGENQFADMITVLIRLAVDWLATGDNADAVIALIEGNAESEEAANSGATLIKLIVKGLNVEPATSGSMAVVYYIFYGLNNAANGLDTLYGNYGQSWDSLVALFGESEDSNVEKVGNFLSSILKEFGGVDVESSKDDCDCNCHSNSSFIRFFFKIANFFRRLFGMNEFKNCECGDAHW